MAPSASRCSARALPVLVAVALAVIVIGAIMWPFRWCATEPRSEGPRNIRAVTATDGGPPAAIDPETAGRAVEGTSRDMAELLGEIVAATAETRRACDALRDLLVVSGRRLTEIDCQRLEACLGESDQYVVGVIVYILSLHDRDHVRVVERACQVALMTGAGQVNAIRALGNMRLPDERVVATLVTILDSLDRQTGSAVVHQATCDALASCAAIRNGAVERLLREIDGLFPEHALNALDDLCRSGYNAADAASGLWIRIPKLAAPLAERAIEVYGAMAARTESGYVNLRELLSSEDRTARKAALKGMANRPDADTLALAAMVRCVDDSDADVRETAGQILLTRMSRCMSLDAEQALATYVGRCGENLEEREDELLGVLCAIKTYGPPSERIGAELLRIGIGRGTRNVRMAALEAYALSDNKGAEVVSELAALLRTADDMEGVGDVASCMGRIILGRGGGALSDDEIVRRVGERREVGRAFKMVLVGDENAVAMVAALRTSDFGVRALQLALE